MLDLNNANFSLGNFSRYLSAGGLSIFVIIILLALLIFFIFKFFKRRTLIKNLLRYKIFKIALPFKEAEDQKRAIEEIALASRLFLGLANKKYPISFEVAVSSIEEKIKFYISLHESALATAFKTIQGLYPEADIIEHEEYNIFSPQNFSAYANLSQQSSYLLPIQTSLNSSQDSFAVVLNSFTKLKKIGEGLAIQAIVSEAPKGLKSKLESALRKVRQGVKLSEAISGEDKKKSKKDDKEERLSVDEGAVKILEEKLKAPLLKVNYRIISSAETESETKAILEGVLKSFDQYRHPSGNSFKAKVRIPKNRNLFDFIYRNFSKKESIILNCDELASMLHLPISGTAIPKIDWISLKESAPPVNLPDNGTLIGESHFRKDNKKVFISDEDRRRHLYLLGQTGTGKSTLIVNMAYEDIKNGKGLCIIDPHGDLAESLAGLIPKERLGDVIIFDPGDISRPMGLNMLEYDASKPEQKTFIVNEIQGIFNKLFTAETMGPMFEQYMRNTLLLLMEDLEDPPTLVDVPRVFTDLDYRKRKLAKCNNPIVKDFWEKEASKVSGEASLANMAPYITSKFGNFIANDYMRPIIGQVKSSFSFREIMDSGKILLVNLSKGKIGDINANLLGMIVVGKILLAGFSRVNIAQESRRDFNLYIDEFQNFTTDSIATILSEARKYRIDLVIANQFIKQLEDKIRDSVFGNVGSMVIYRVGAEDAEFLSKYFEPYFDKNHFVNLPNFNAYVKLLINGNVSTPFNMVIPKPPKADPGNAQKIKELSRLKYGGVREEIESSIKERLKRPLVETATLTK